MAKTYNLYYAAYRVLSQTNFKDMADMSGLKAGDIYISSRFVDTLLLNNGLYKKLGFFLMTDIARAGASAVRTPTTINLGTQSDGQRISLFRMFSVVLVPKVSSWNVAPFGQRYPTRIPASSVVDDRQVADVLYGATFNFVGDGESAEYMVLQGSAQQLRAKRTANKLPSM